MGYTLEKLKSLLKVRLVGSGNFQIQGVSSLENAGPDDASFLANPRYFEAMKESKAGVICISSSEFDEKTLPPDKNYFFSEDPSRTFQEIAELLISSGKSAFTGIHPTAIIHESAKIGRNVVIGPYSVIDRDVTISDDTEIGPHVTIGFEVQIGSNCQLFANSVIRERCILKDRVILQPGAVIGSCGFGYTPDKEGNHIKLEQLGIVILEDDVEIGANTTIDRARFKATRIGKGTKIDNLVQIAHNVEIGEHNILAAQTGVAGSSKTGKYVMLGGQAGVLGHVELEDHVLVATRGGVSKSLKAGKYRGSPAIPINEYHRQEVHVRKLDEYVKRLKSLEKKLK